MRHQYIKSKLNNMISALEVIKNNPGISSEEIKAKAGLKGGTGAATTADIKIVKAVKNGNGLHLTKLGERYLEQPDFIENRREIGLNVPLFNKYFSDHPHEKNLEKIKQHFKEVLSSYYNNDSTLDINASAAALRYIELIHGIKKFGRISRKIQSKTVTIKQPIGNTEKKEITLDRDLLIEIGRLMQKYQKGKILYHIESWECVEKVLSQTNEAVSCGGDSKVSKNLIDD